MTSAPSTTRQPRYPAWLGVASFGWAVAGWGLAASAPRLAFVPRVEALHLLLPAVTAALILANLAFSLHALYRRNVPIDRLLLVTGLQVGLFTTLFFQFAAHLGADRYSLQKPTRSWEWVQFSIAHAIRAADVLDAIEAYGWDVQVIKHRGPFVASALVAYHVVIDLFVLELIWTMLRRLRKRLLAEPARFAIAFLLGVLAFLVWFCVWMAFATHVRPWRPIDVPLWFAENVVRVVDFADAMDSFDVRWHQVPAGPVESTLTFFCRVWIAVAISFVVSTWRVGRKSAAPEVAEGVPVSPWSFSRLGVAAVVISAIVGADADLQAGSSEQVAELTAVATGDDIDRAHQAMAALRRLGPNARDAVGPLADARSRLPERSAKIVETLGSLGPDAIVPLRVIASNQDESDAEAAVACLRRIGPKAAPALVTVWAATWKRKVREAAEVALRDFGREAMPPLVEATDETNAAAHLHWFEKLDRDWPSRDSSNRAFRAIVQLKRFRDRVTRSGGSRSLSDEFGVRVMEQDFITGQLIDDIRACGKLALPVLINALSNKDDDARRIAIEALGELGPQAASAVPELRISLDRTHFILPSGTFSKNDPVIRRLAAVALGKIGPSAGEAEEALVKVLADEDPELRRAAADALAKIGPWRGESVAALRKALTDQDGEVRRAAATALGMCRGYAREALPELTKLASDEKTVGSAEARKAIERIGGK